MSYWDSFRETTTLHMRLYLIYCHTQITQLLLMTGFKLYIPVKRYMLQGRLVGWPIYKRRRVKMV